MPTLVWDQTGERLYETGVDHGVLYIPDSLGAYMTGVAWNGLTSVSENPTGAEANAQYADNIKYLTLMSAEEFGATLEAFTYPDEFDQFDGLASPVPGVTVGQQTRKAFGLSYRTLIGNDLDGNDHGYKLHLVYGCMASPSEKAYNTVNDTPEPITFSWEISTTPVPVTGLKPTSVLIIDSTEVEPTVLAAIEAILYGDDDNGPSLPTPDEIIAIFEDSPTLVTPVEPGFTASTGVIVIPSVTGVVYRRDDTSAIVTGSVTIATPGASLTIIAEPLNASYAFTPLAEDEWEFERDA